MSLLLKVKPLVISPVLAQRIGLNEAIVLQQICYWLEETESGVEHDGKRWIYNTIEGWSEQFPFWSQDTIKRALTSLKKRGLIYVEQLKKSQHDRTNFYSINHQNPLLTDEGNLHPSKGAVCPVRKMQAAPVHQSSLHSSIRANCPDLTEITTENTTENKTPSCPDASPPDDSPVENPDEFLARYPDAVVYSAKKRHWGSHEDLKCAEWIWRQITHLYEQAAETDGELAKPREPNWAAWANDVRLMCSQDQRTHRQICQLFRRVQGDPFWCRNILSPAKLREKWDELVVRLGPVQRSVTDISPVDYAIPEGFRGY